MPALICGSLAFDTIATFPGRFADQILPDHIHILNTSFLVPSLRREFGGCAGNIAYSLKKLGGEPLPMATVGADGDVYLARLRDLGIDARHVALLPECYSAQCHITTDRDNNQITAFHPGAMEHAVRLVIPNPRGEIAIGIIAPDGRDAMLRHAEQMAEAGIPFIFDPGQGLPLFNGDELRHFVELATWVAVNDYEGRMLCDRTGADLATLSRSHLKGLVVTLGHEGCDVWVDGQVTRVAGVQAEAVVDPTGCGDAFRAALLYGLERGWDLVRCVELGNRVGAIKIAAAGTQNHRLDPVALGLATA
jgi:adenosine kinase